MPNPEVAEVISLIETQAKKADEFRAVQTARIDNVEKWAREIEKKAGRPGAELQGTFGPDSHAAAAHETWIDVKSKKSVPVLRHDQSLAALETKAESQPSLGRVLRGIVLGGTAHDAHELEAERKSMNIFGDPSGGYTVSGALSSQWIDSLRAQMVLSRAGAVTFPMDAGQVGIARVTADPTCTWRGESVALPEASPTFGRVNLNAKTVVCLVKMSLELAQDSANIEQQLQNVIVNAMAAAIDSAGLNGSATDQAAAPDGIYNASGINQISTVGAPTDYSFVLDGMYELLADNVSMTSIGALIGHPKIWRKLAGLKTGITSDLTTLVQPPEVAAVPKLWTTAAPFTGGTTCSAIIGDWRDLVFGVRKDIQIRVLSESFMGSNLQVAVLAYARVDFQPTRATSFCVMPGITI